jgi:hypothetical protein
VEAHLGSHRLVHRSDIYSMMAIQRIGEELRGTRGYPYHNTEESVRPRLCILNWFLTNKAQWRSTIVKRDFLAWRIDGGIDVRVGGRVDGRIDRSVGGSVGGKVSWRISWKVGGRV